jgi:hypothetical protein
MVHAVRSRLMRLRKSRRKLAGLGQDYDDSYDPSSYSGIDSGSDFNVTTAGTGDELGSSVFTDIGVTPVTNVPLQATLSPLPSVTLENAVGWNNVSSPDAYGNQLVGLSNPDGSTTVTGVANSVTDQYAPVTPNSTSQISNALTQFSKAAATLLGGSSSQIAAAGKPPGYTSQSSLSSWLQGSSAEYVVFGGVALILLLAITSQRRR